MSKASELGQFIPIHYHYQMLLDQARILGFQKAIDAMVTPNSKVLELGGGTGVLSYFASKKAAKVTCVELHHELAENSRKYLELNGTKNVEVIEADAAEFVPAEPVDFVICEMLHAAMLREQQTSVITSFQKNYQAKHGKLPVFIPATTLLAAQPVHQVFSFCGYKANIPLFFPAGMENTGTSEIAAPHNYSTFHYDKALPQHFVCNDEFTALCDGEVNAIRFITKHILAYLLEENSSVNWYNLYLMMPLNESISVKTGERFKVAFSYPSGGTLEELMAAMTVKKV